MCVVVSSRKPELFRLLKEPNLYLLSGVLCPTFQFSRPMGQSWSDGTKGRKSRQGFGETVKPGGLEREHTRTLGGR